MEDLRAEPGQIVEHGKTACALADELREMRSRWADGTTQPGDACGFAEATKAYIGMNDDWFDELGIYIRVLEELCAGVQAAGQGYQQQDQSVAKGMNPLL